MLCRGSYLADSRTAPPVLAEPDGLVARPRGFIELAENGRMRRFLVRCLLAWMALTLFHGPARAGSAPAEDCKPCVGTVCSAPCNSGAAALDCGPFGACAPAALLALKPVGAVAATLPVPASRPGFCSSHFIETPSRPPLA